MVQRAAEEGDGTARGRGGRRCSARQRREMVRRAAEEGDGAARGRGGRWCGARRRRAMVQRAAEEGDGAARGGEARALSRGGQAVRPHRARPPVQGF